MTMLHQGDSKWEEATKVAAAMGGTEERLKLVSQASGCGSRLEQVPW